MERTAQFMAGYADAVRDINDGKAIRNYRGNPETEYRNGYLAACEDRGIEII